MKLKSFLPSFKRRGRRVLYISEDVEVGEVKSRVDIVLSPKFYWIKREELSVKKERDALKFAPSIFEGQFSNIEDYRFLAIKRGDSEYIFLAYNPKDILEKLQNEFHISEKFLGDIYTAQSELMDIDEPLSLNRVKKVVSIDGIVSEIPKFSHENSINYAGEFLKKSNRSRFKLKYRGIDGEGGSLFVASLIPLAIVVYLTLDIIRLSSDSNYLQSEIERRRDVYSLPSTSFQIESIKNRYEKLESEQSKIRDSLFWLQDIKFSQYGKIEYLAIDRREFKFKLNVKNSKSLNKIKSELQKRDKEVEFSENKTVLEVSFR